VKENTDFREVLPKVLGDVARMQILAALGERPASAKEIAEETDQPVSKVRYHLRFLSESGLIESIKEEPRRGVVERFYRPSLVSLIDAKETASLSRAERRRISLIGSRVAFEDVTASLGSGRFDNRTSQPLSHIRLRVDSEGWEELQRIHGDALAKVLEAKKSSEERLQIRQGAEEIRAVSILMSFELPARLSKSRTPTDGRP
jgi:DNA-binding transcriptional ArsR family regulator